MEVRIPTVAAYPWAPNEQQISCQESRKRKGSGYSVLEQALIDSRTSERATEILTGLLGNDIVGATTDDSNLLPTTSLPLKKQIVQPLETVNPNAPLDDNKALSLAQGGRLSLLGSIIRVVRESISTPVSTKQILTTCLLAVRPGDVPGEMDAREMVLAALLFLSSTHKSDYWTLPLIRPTENEDLENCTYEVVETPTDSQLQWLETAFLSSPDRYLAREKFCPRLKNKDEGPLLLKGTIPASATPNTPAAKRRATMAAKAAAAATLG